MEVAGLGEGRGGVAGERVAELARKPAAVVLYGLFGGTIVPSSRSSFHFVTHSDGQIER